MGVLVFPQPRFTAYGRFSAYMGQKMQVRGVFPPITCKLWLTTLSKKLRYLLCEYPADASQHQLDGNDDGRDFVSEPLDRESVQDADENRTDL